MKITDVKATPVVVPMKHSPTQSKVVAGPRVMPSIIVQVFTDEGIVGVGEAPQLLGGQISAQFIETTKTLLVGKDPANINLLVRSLYAQYSLSHFHIHSGCWAVNGVEMALWDIAGKRAGMPLYQLWGGAYRKQIEFFGDIDRQEPAGMTQVAERLADEGYHTIYTKVGFGLDSDMEALAAIRAGAPDPNVKIRVDANQSWNTGEAIHIINNFEQFGMEFIDQPVLMYNLDALKHVHDSVHVPIAAHESGWTMYDMLNVVKSGAVDYVHLDPRFDAGITGSRISAGIAEAAGIQCVRHAFFELSVAFAMFLHLCAATPNATLPHQHSEYDMLEDDVIKGGLFQFHGPYCDVPEGPGLGVEIDEDKLAKYHEAYVKDILEAGLEFTTENHYYGAMFLRPYLKDLHEGRMSL